MSRSTVILAALSEVPSTTSEVYERAGYPALARVGLIPYARFRGELARLAEAGLVAQESAEDGSTLWSLAARPDAA